MNKVAVIIPLYRPELYPLEDAAVRQTVKMLGDVAHLYILYPRGMKITADLEYYDFKYMEVSDEWLGTKNGIAGYNNMMMNISFYQLFKDYEYMLICHTDSWIFRNELIEWCEKGYDCVAAPWVKRRIHNIPVFKQIKQLFKYINKKSGKHDKHSHYGKIGNGGLSLRKIDSFISACSKYEKEIQFFLTHSEPSFNEDVFWAVIPKEFSYPSEKEALKFSISKHPEYCYKMNNQELPFGCHAWNKSEEYKFWKNIIKV